MARVLLVSVLCGAMVVGPAPATPAATFPASRADACPGTSVAGDQLRMTVRKAKAAGTTFAWAEFGRGRPLVLLNGTGSPMADWDPALLAGLAQGRRVIVFDYAGLGLSGAAPGRITFPAMADWTADLIRALGLGRADVLGWSMGGFVAQQLAVRHPAVVRRLVLAGTNPGGPATVLGPDWVQEADSDADGTIAAYLATNYPHTSCAQAAGRAFVRRLVSAVKSGRYPDESTPTRTYDAMVRAEDPWLASSANLRALTGLDLPTLVITGNDDVVTPPANSRIIAGRIPGATLDFVDGAGHSFLFQKPTLTARLVLDFLRAG